MTVAVLSLGSNLGDPERFLADAIAEVESAVRAVSSVYRTPPWGPVAQDDFRNLVTVVEDPGLDAGGWWRIAQGLEAAAHRERSIRWGPRTLDVDVIAVWADSAQREPIISGEPSLILPHPRAHERGFVLVPWMEIQPDAILPGHGPIAELVARVDAAGIERMGPLASG